MRTPLASPKAYIREIDWHEKTARLLMMSRAHYVRSSFLDHRTQAAGPEKTIPLAELKHQLAELPKPHKGPHFIFHTTFCGSTLLSRCLDRVGICLAYKEPYLLHDLAFRARSRWILKGQIDLTEYMNIALLLLSRTYRHSERALIKPSDSCNNLAVTLLQAHETSRALLLYSDLDSFVVSNLHHVSRRLHLFNSLERACYDLHQLGFPDFDPNITDPARAAATVWLSLMMQHLAVLEETSLEVRSLDSAEFYARPFETLQAASAFFDLAHRPADLQREVEKGAFKQDAKKQDQTYDSGQAEQRRAAQRAGLETVMAEAELWVQRLTPERALPRKLPRALLTSA